jgi:asparagine synthase (glutamine-hydrolysing)
MCGIFGLIGHQAPEAVKAANRLIAHRGPDAEGYWFDDKSHLFLCHRRLSILDLSEAGAQPMKSDQGRFVITYNGEIYNFAELKGKLSKTQWRGHSDTEILLACFEEWGIEKTLHEIEGMYAIALWDTENQQLTLVRDRLGEKPLYYGVIEGEFVFSSELKPIIKLYHSKLSINENALSDFFHRSCISRDLSIFEGIKKLPAGSYLQVSVSQGRVKAPLTVPQKYWNLKELPLGQNELSADQGISLIEEKLKKSIRQQIVADVPLGAFLSGGIDSSLVVALMQSISSRKIKSFSIGFGDALYNEAHHAKSVAGHLGTEHEELYVSAQDLLDQVPQLAGIYDEPFADSSQIPTILVSKMARSHVTVALSGDGGDELFAGYNRHQFAYQNWEKMQNVPGWARGLAAKVLKTFPPKVWAQIFKVIDSGASQPHEKVFKLAKVLEAGDLSEFYKLIATHWGDQSPLADKSLMFNCDDFQIDYAHEMTRADASWYMPDDVLVKVDRAAMSQSLETRAPFLNKEVVEVAFSLPMSLKIRDGKTKWILRQILYKYVPQELIERPKMGFGVPLDSWLRQELKDWAWDLLNPAALKSQSRLDSQVILKKWDEHQAGIRNWQTELWDVLMYLSWCQQYKF